MITIDPNKICYIFDVDGTLTEPRKQMDNSFSNELIEWMKDKQCFIATGSDYKKTKEQVPDNVLKNFKYTFCCMGNEVRNQAGNVIKKSDFIIPGDLEAYLENVLLWTKYPHKYGNHIEFRTGMVNFSVVGRNATMEQRLEYNKWDNINNERERTAKVINTSFPTLEASVGGSISIDIIQKGCDKGQVVHYLKDAGATKIVFVGDKCYNNGNDYGIIRELQNSDLAFEWYNVEGPSDTLGLIRINEVFRR